MKQTTLLCILDGFGYREEQDYNAIANAKMPNWERFVQQYPFSLLKTSGLDVGLPEGQMGNSEVGHMNIGSGRVNLQMLPRLNQEVADDSLKNHTLYQDLKQNTKNSCHIFGILSDGGVHGHLDHLVYIAQDLANNKLKIKLHLFLDGRDTPPKSAEKYLKNLLNEIENFPNIEIATMCGRYYAMDRDRKWERTKLASDAINFAKAQSTDDFLDSLLISYENGVNDEFVLPVVSSKYEGLKDGDSFIMTNFRADRVRQIIPALLDPNFREFPVSKVKFSAQFGISQYADDISQYLPCLFPNEIPKNTLADILEANNLKQLHIAETEKYAHVTFFFNGGLETEKKGEKRVLIKSPNVATYDLKPEMSALGVLAELEQAIEKQEFDFIVVNFANPDMVGHTGNYEAAIKAAEIIDKCLGALEKQILKHNGNFFITADHGNLEEMYNYEKKQANTAHTLNPVPFMLLNKMNNITLKDGKLADIAPTILDIMNLQIPNEMTGKSLLEIKND